MFIKKTFFFLNKILGVHCLLKSNCVKVYTLLLFCVLFFYFFALIKIKLVKVVLKKKSATKALKTQKILFYKE